MRHVITAIRARLARLLDAGWDDTDAPTHASDDICSCPGGSVSQAGDPMETCPRCGGRVRYLSQHPTDEARNDGTKGPGESKPGKRQ